MNNTTGLEIQESGKASIIKAYGLTDKGKVRENNEDNFYIDADSGFFVVSDGIGGGQAGEKASEVVVKILPVQLKISLNFSDADGALEKAIKILSHQLCQYAGEEEELEGAGATVVACLIRDGTAWIGHMGDSRAYLLRKGIFEQLTEDHSVVAIMLNLGQITKRQARRHPARHTITRYAGMKGEVYPDIRAFSLNAGDKILLCTDGLTDMVSERETGQIMLEEPDLEKICKKLIDTANTAGGRDNITAVVIQYGEESKENKKRKKVRVKRFQPAKSCQL